MEVCGIAFDLEGTIVDLERFHHAAHIHAAEIAGVRLSLSEAISKIECFIGGPDEAVADELTRFPGCRLSANDILKLKKHRYEELFKKSIVLPRHGFDEFIKTVELDKYEISVGTITTSEKTKHILERSGLINLFPATHIVARETVARLKPAPDIYLETARRMQINPHSQIVFEDSVNGIRAATAAGSLAVAVPTIQDREFWTKLEQAGAFRVYADWGAVACGFSEIETGLRRRL